MKNIADPLQSAVYGLYISWCDESGSKWNKPLQRGTGVRTAPCLIFDAEGTTLKFGFGHERVGCWGEGGSLSYNSAKTDIFPLLLK